MGPGNDEKKTGASAVITFENVYYSYDRVPVLSAVHFEVREGDVVTIVGPNGGGKSTLLKLMLGLIAPLQGRVRVYSGPPRQALHRMGYVPQYSPFDASFPITALEIVVAGAFSKAFGMPGRQARTRAKEALSEVGLADLATRQFSSLSGGERQRVLIARALAKQPDILILDEPTANVDVVAENDLAELLKKVCRGKTLVLVTHDLGFVDEATTRVFCVNREVHEHPANQMDGSLIYKSYGRNVKTVSHDVDLCETGER